jgi:lysophospholipase L1-like esterase
MLSQMGWLAIPRITLLALALAVVLAVPVSADEVPTDRLGADVSVPGVISLGFFGNPGAVVFFDERTGDSVKRIGSQQIGPSGYTVMKDAAIWRCDRTERKFEGTAINPDGTRAYGTYDVRTGSCAQRFKIVAPVRVGIGKSINVQIFDRWKIGGYPTLLCINPPKGSHSCRVMSFKRGVSVGSRTFKATRRGIYVLELKVAGFTVRRSIVVGKGGGRLPVVPVVLATGDSTMQGIDSFLADRLVNIARVRDDVFPGTGISRTLAWVARAATQAARTKPRVTVISIGAGEGVNMKAPDGTPAPCCGAQWLAEYTRRVTEMMKSYSRNGKGRVLWLTIPVPRSDLLAAITGQVNKAIIDSAEGRPTVRVLRLDEVFTPHGYADVIHYRGQDVKVRADDGVHLNVAGTAIAAEEIEQALRTWPDSGLSKSK